MNELEIKTCYDCGKEITEADKITFEDSDLCEDCYYDRNNWDEEDQHISG